MNDFQTAEGVARATNIRDIRQVASARNSAFAVPFATTSNIPAGGVVSLTQKIDNSYAFVATAFSGVLHDGSGGAVATRVLVTVELSANDGSYFFAPVPYDSIVGTGVQPFFPLFAYIFPPGATVTWRVQNGTAGNIQCAIVAHGHRLGIT